MDSYAKFNIGDVVKHTKLGYRAVVVDVDSLFQASGHYNPQAIKHPFTTRNPWYRLLVDESSQMTYVEEYLLEQSSNKAAITNPQLDYYLASNANGYRHNLPHH